MATIRPSPAPKSVRRAAGGVSYAPPRVEPTRRALTLAEAVEASSSLASLTRRAQDASARLKAIEALIPMPLRAAVKAGPVSDDGQGTEWCLIVNSTAAAAKLRQLTPAFTAELRRRGWEVTAIRLKVQSPP